MSVATAPRAEVAGWPVAHSRSPLIHNYWLRTLGIDGSYERFAVEPGAFHLFVERMRRGEIVGANVTVPHKEAAFAACDWLAENARGLGAVNTLWLENGQLCGDNTDITGFLDNMDESAPGWSEAAKRALVIGAGGAARGVLRALRARGVEKIALANRGVARAEALARDTGGEIEIADLRDLPTLLRDADLLINTTSLGMVGQPSLSIDLSQLPREAIVADIVYVPLRTALLEQAAARGHRIVGGLGMLLHQAAPGFQRWFGVRPRVTAELRALVEADVAAAHPVPR